MEVAKDKYEDLLLMMIINNEFSFSLVESESESFEDFVHFLRDNAPNISRATMRRRHNAIYEKAFQTLKEKRDHNTIDEWECGNNFDFLGITLHFYNNIFGLENQLLGSRNYRGEVLYESFMKVYK